MEKIFELWEIDAVKRVVISIVVILIVVIIWLIARHIRRTYAKKKGIDGKFNATTSMQAVIYDTIKVAVFAILILTILQINGVNVTSLIAGVGVVSAVIGLALQDFLKDIIMGVHVLTDKFYELGDLVQYMDEEGIVEDFNLRTTKIRSIMDGDLIVICNRNIDKITRSGQEVYIRVPLPYELPVGRAHEIMADIAKEIAEKDEITACSFLGTTEFNASSASYLLKLEIETPEAKLRTRRAGLKVVQEVLEQEKIAIPFDQVDVHMK
ncbi:MAG: mechanosensitive ion channel family protein [Eubacterium sp.]|nr:mechanosensitive ion channel family protein [Eubacterium sp.]